jgi:squalene-associated FAD-dependent desaturase
MTADRIVVIGGGLAGISAAIELADRGLPVTVLESRPWLGGATWSFGRRGLTIDNGQHAFLRCFSSYQDLLIRLGVDGFVDLQGRLDLTVLAADGQQRIRRNSWPAPFHLAKTLAGYGLLSRGERLGVVPAVMTMWLSDLSRHRRSSVAEWLGRHGQGARARRQFWEVFLVPVLNAVSEQADLGTAAGFINAALLTSRDRADLGMSSVPLRDLHGGPASRVLAALGAEVRVSTQAMSVTSRRGGGFHVRVDAADESQPAGYEIDAAGVVLAVPAWSAAELVPREISADINAWRKLRPSPVVSIHVMYDSQVTRLPFAVTGESALRWIVDKTRSAGLHTGQYLAASIPAADKFVDAPSAVIRGEFLPVLERLFPAAAAAQVEDFFVTRERGATFRPVPGSAAFRPSQMTNLPGFALAGAWTSTGWPDTMEGAVRSGRRAAQSVLRALMPSEVDAELDRPQPRIREVAAAMQAMTTRFVIDHGTSDAVEATAAKPGDAAESGAATKPAEAAESAEVSESAEPPEPAEAAEPEPTGEPPVTVTAAEAAESAEASEPAKPAEAAQSENASSLLSPDVTGNNAPAAEKGTTTSNGTLATKRSRAGKGTPGASGSSAANGKPAAPARGGGIKSPVALTAPDVVPQRAKAAGQ